MDQKKLISKHAAQHADLTDKIVEEIVTPKLSHRVYTKKDISEFQKKLTEEMSVLYVLGFRHAMETVQNKIEENKKAKNK